MSVSDSLSLLVGKITIRKTSRLLKLTQYLPGQVLLISDQTTDKAAAALDVEVGSLSDPADLPGLAHFCEHMLFLGTEQFPQEDDYEKFIINNGGSNNASTYNDHTKYYFDVGQEHLDGALERFSHFFKTPLFNKSAVDREVNAVHSEYLSDLAVDYWRLDQLNRSTCDPTHDFSKFTIGNKESLWTKPTSLGEDVRQRLLEFHSQWYSSNIMSLAVLGRESLDTLQQMVIDKFKDLPNKERF